MHKDVRNMKAFLLLRVCKYHCTRYHGLLLFIPLTVMSLLTVTVCPEEQCQNIRKTRNG